jgi:O-antigen ligase
MHPSYFSLYVGFNCLYIFYKISLLNKLEIKFKRKLILYLIVSLLLIFGILILSSKAGILITGAALVFFALKELFYKKIILFILLSLIVIFVLFMNSIYHNKIQALSRFEEAKKELSTKYNNPNEKSGSSNSRLEIWKACKSILLNNLAYGVGTGDIKDELLKQYKKGNFEHGIVNQNNCHNQYLQFFILFGLGGGLLFLISLFYPTYISIQNKNILYLYFMFFMLSNMLVESMLESKAGVEFFALINALLLNYKPRINK